MWIVFSKQIEIRAVERPFLSFCWKATCWIVRWFLIALFTMFLIQSLR